MRWVYAIDAWTNWMIAAGVSIRTIELRRGQMRRLAEANLRRSPWRVNTNDLIQWMSGQSWSQETRRSNRATLRAFYKWAAQSGRTRRNPAAALPSIPAPHTVPRPTPDEVITEALRSGSDRDRLILSLAAYAGLRRAEIACLRWDHIELEWLRGATGGRAAEGLKARNVSAEGVGAPTIRVHGKGNKVRLIPIHPELQRLICAEKLRRNAGRSGTGYRYTAGLDGPWLFPGQCDGHMTPAALGKTAVRALGPGWGAHSLRHRFATRVYAGTHDLLAVQELLGHAKPETSRRYTQLSDGALSDAVNTI
jgi:integrase